MKHKPTLYSMPSPCGMGNHSWYDCPQCSVYTLWKYPEQITTFVINLMEYSVFGWPTVDEQEMRSNFFDKFVYTNWRYKVLEGIREIRFKDGHESAVEKIPDDIRLRNKDLQEHRGKK